MLSVKLKEQTKINHQLLEKKLVGRMKAITGKQQYAHLLAIFYSFFCGLEASINEHATLLFLPDHLQRRKSASLAEDLLDLDFILPAIANADALPEIKNDLQAIGAMYVMEGSTLGGKFIVKMIKGQIGETDNCGVSFFNGYGEATQKMWDTFKQAIDGILLKDEEELMVIQAAGNTFLKFSEWFDKLQ